MDRDELSIFLSRIISRIKFLRLKKNYKQEYMAARMGCSQNSYSKIEVGHTELTVKSLIKIASILDEPLCIFLEEKTIEGSN